MFIDVKIPKRFLSYLFLFLVYIQEIAPLIKIEVPKPEIPEINLNLQIEEFEAKPQPVQPQENAPIGGREGTLVKLAA